MTRPVIEHVLPPQRDGQNAFADVMSSLNGDRRAGYLRVMGIDISEWMKETDTKQFKDFLRFVESRLSNFIVVFRIPFVDKEVLDRLRYSLNDLMTVRPVTFPPLTKEEIRSCAERSLKQFGFRMSRGAWEMFQRRITEEKGDGRFYGINTVEKVVRELLYKKQLQNAKIGKSDFCIGKKDALSLCSAADPSALSGYEMLNRLVGNGPVKARIEEIVAQIEMAVKDKSVETPCIHMRFVGNPGTGKTTVARILGKILKERGVLRIGAFYEYSGRDFCGRYVGETAPKTSGMCRDAYGSVLFIDEAYSLYHEGASGIDYGREALDTLIAEMENHRADFVVIMAGYTDEMEHLMRGNSGLASRMPYLIEFPNFTREELYQIYRSMVQAQFKYEPALLEAAHAYFLGLPEEFVNSKEFSNARFVRNLFERTWAKASMRCQLAKKSSIELTKDDFDRSVCDKEFALINEKKPTRLGF